MGTIYSTKEAAKYLAVKPETIRYHVYVSGLLTAQKVGNSLLFTQGELDRFKAAGYKRGVKNDAKLRE